MLRWVPREHSGPTREFVWPACCFCRDACRRPRERHSKKLKQMHAWGMHRRTRMQVGREVQKILNRKSIIVSAVLGTAMLFSTAAHGQQMSVVLDGMSKGRVFDGLG